jgi:hypothetical protein
MTERRPLFFTVACVAALCAHADPATTAAPPEPLSLDAIKEQLLHLGAVRLNGLLGQSPSGGPETFQIQRIEPDGEDGEGGWGLAYDWRIARSTARMTEKEDILKGEPFGFSRMSYQLALRGSHAFSDATNNEDLSTATVSLQLDRANLGKASINEAAGTAFQLCLMDIGPASGDPEERRRQDAQQKECIDDNGIAKLVADEPTAWLYNLNLHGGLEGNQDYTNSRSLFGLSAVFVSQPSVAASRYNLLDWPFRKLRESMSPGSRYRAPFPSLAVSLDRLDASDDELRAAFTDRSTFTRASAALAFQTILATFDEGPLRLNASYRYFHELSAPAEIEAAGFDEFDYTKMRLSFPASLLPAIESGDYELFVSFTSGRLPFDLAPDQAIEIGISTNIDVLAQLLTR